MVGTILLNWLIRIPAKTELDRPKIGPKDRASQKRKKGGCLWGALLNFGQEKGLCHIKGHLKTPS